MEAVETVRKCPWWRWTYRLASGRTDAETESGIAGFYWYGKQFSWRLKVRISFSFAALHRVGRERVRPDRCRQEVGRFPPADWHPTPPTERILPSTPGDLLPAVPGRGAVPSAVLPELLRSVLQTAEGFLQDQGRRPVQGQALRIRDDYSRSSEVRSAVKEKVSQIYFLHVLQAN